MPRDPEQPPARFSATEIGLATLLFTALTVILAYPISLHPASLRVDMGVDGDLGWYILSWDAHAFLHHPWAIFDANIYYPDRYTLAYGENIIGLAFFAAPVIWLTGNAALATTLVSLLSCVLCGLGAYVLARRVGLSMAAAIICGVIFECAPPRFFRIGQITLTNIQWIPFALASAHAYFDYGKKRDLRLTAGCVSLQVLSSGHGAVFVTLCLLLLGLYRVVLGEPWRIAQRIRDLGVVGAALLLPSVLIFLPYRQVQVGAGLKRGLGSWDTTWASFLASPSDFHRYLYKLFGATQLLDAETTLFPGFLAIALAAAAVAWRRRAAPDTQQAPVSSMWAGLAFWLDIVMVGAGIVGTLLTAARVFDLRIGSVWLDGSRGVTLSLTTLLAAALLAVLVGRRTASGTRSRLRTPVLCVTAVMAAGAIIAAVRPTLGAGDGLVGDYFTNAEWSGRPAFTAVDTRFSAAHFTRRWEEGSPERFSVRWTGFLTVLRAGTYTFSTTSDDGSYVLIDGFSAPVVDNGGSHSAQTRSGRIGLAQGTHQIELRYMQTGAGATFDWSWSRNDGTASAVPLWALSRQRPAERSVVVVRLLDWAASLLAVAGLIAAAWALRVWLSGSAPPVIATWAAARRRDMTTFYALLTLLSFGLALGPPYGLWQYVYWLPAFNFIRASSRFTLLTLLGLAVLAAIGFDRITKGWARERRNVLAGVLSVVLLVEYASVPFGYAQTHLEIPAIDRWLAGQPKPFVIAEVPARSEQDQVDYMNHTTVHWQKTIQGYHGWRRDFHEALYADMRGFPDARSLERLTELRVTYVVVHQERYSPEEWAQVEDGLRRFASQLRLEHVEGSGRVYSVISPGSGGD